MKYLLDERSHNKPANLWYTNMALWITLPETTSEFTPENGWLEDEAVSFWAAILAYFLGLARCSFPGKSIILWDMQVTSHQVRPTSVVEGWCFFYKADLKVILLMEEIWRSPVEVGSWSQYWQAFVHSRWCRISSINSTPLKTNEYPLKTDGTGRHNFLFQRISRWWFQTFFIFTPIWGRFPFWLIFFKGVEATNQIYIRSFSSGSGNTSNIHQPTIGFRSLSPLGLAMESMGIQRILPGLFQS